MDFGDRSLFMAGVAPKRNVFLGKHFAEQPLKSQPWIQLKNKYPPWPKTLQNSFSHSGFYRLQFFSFRVLRITAFLIPGFTNSGFSHSVFTDSGFSHSGFYRFQIFSFRFYRFRENLSMYLKCLWLANQSHSRAVNATCFSQ